MRKRKFEQYPYERVIDMLRKAGGEIVGAVALADYAYERHGSPHDRMKRFYQIMARLRDGGYPIENIRGKGYRWTGCLDPNRHQISTDQIETIRQHVLDMQDLLDHKIGFVVLAVHKESDLTAPVAMLTNMDEHGAKMAMQVVLRSVARTVEAKLN